MSIRAAAATESKVINLINSIPSKPPQKREFRLEQSVVYPADGGSQPATSRNQDS